MSCDEQRLHLPSHMGLAAFLKITHVIFLASRTSKKIPTTGRISDDLRAECGV